jgi:hypothetical protein
MRGYGGGWDARHGTIALRRRILAGALRMLFSFGRARGTRASHSSAESGCRPFSLRLWLHRSITYLGDATVGRESARRAPLRGRRSRRAACPARPGGAPGMPTMHTLHSAGQWPYSAAPARAGAARRVPSRSPRHPADRPLSRPRSHGSWIDALPAVELTPTLRGVRVSRRLRSRDDPLSWPDGCGIYSRPLFRVGKHPPQNYETPILVRVRRSAPRPRQPRWMR